MRSCILGLVLLAGAGAAAEYGELEVAQLMELAASEKEPEATRARAVRELARTDLRTHMPLLRRLLREERSLDIRLSAACTLAAHGDRKAPTDLLLVTAYDRKRTANCSRTDVLLALARTGNPAAELHLANALKDEAPRDEPYFHADACRALGVLGTPGARRLLLEALRDGSATVRHAAVTGVSRMALDRACPERSTAADAIHTAARHDPEEKVAEQAASALLWVGVDGPGFFRLLGSDPDPKVRARCARVMDRHYLSGSRVARLRTALAREQEADVRAAMQATLDSQRKPGP